MEANQSVLRTSLTARLVHGYLLGRAGPGGITSITQKELARQLGVSKSSIRRATKKLAALGLVSISGYNNQTYILCEE